MSPWKKRFPLLVQRPSLVYLDSAATSQKPQEVIDAMLDYLQKECGTVHRAVYSLASEATWRYNQVRDLVRDFIGARTSQEVIFTRGTTQGINLVAFSFGEAFVQEGDEIIVCETEHHANIVPWQMLCRRKKAVCKVLPVNNEGEISLSLLRECLSSKTVKLVAIAALANATGVTHPVREVISLAHEYGAKVLVDAAQAVAHGPCSVQELDADFLVFSAHKMYGPTGVGILYGKQELLEAMPPYETGGDMIQKVSFTKTTFQDPPLKFEAGTPSIAEVLGLGGAIQFLQEIGWSKLHAYEEELAVYAQGALSRIPGLSFLVKPKVPSSIVSFSCEGCHPLDIGMMLDSREICVRTGHLCAQPALQRFGRTAVVRASLALYTEKEDIDRLTEALKETICLLRS
ncbi:MAG: SufS family cysteine desulfurase [Chlamydiae bacterium]|nr:SufS family cysteine desulfurase [Chlamydiota bacterium]